LRRLLSYRKNRSRAVSTARLLSTRLAMRVSRPVRIGMETTSGLVELAGSRRQLWRSLTMPEEGRGTSYELEN
jgi:hypothetical protein